MQGLNSLQLGEKHLAFHKHLNFLVIGSELKFPEINDAIRIRLIRNLGYWFSGGIY
jgi:hypothetical protein